MSQYGRQPDDAAPGDTGGGAVPTCYRHSGRETYIRCQRCGRPICPDCMHEATVGVQCPECVREGQRSGRSARGHFGGVLQQHDNLVTKIIIGINVVIFLLVQIPGAFSQELLNNLALIGGGGLTITSPIGGVAGGEVWRLLTSAFVHAQFWHIGINMFSLWLLGPLVERLLGRSRYLGLYLVAALAGSAVAYAFTPPNVWIVGASGALFGVFGAIVVFARRLQADMRWILVTIVINVVLNVVFAGALSWQAHVGGFVSGLLLGVALAYAPRERRTLVQVAGYAGVVLVAVALVAWRTLELH